MDPSVLEVRLAAKIAVSPGGCWVWTGARDRRGYGRYNDYPRGTVFAHRLVYEALVGAIPPAHDMDHLCRRPFCVNPLHLEPVTHAENVRRGAMTGKVHPSSLRFRTHCARGHALVGDNVYTSTTRSGYTNRQCRECKRTSSLERYYRLKVRAA